MTSEVVPRPEPIGTWRIVDCNATDPTEILKTELITLQRLATGVEPIRWTAVINPARALDAPAELSVVMSDECEHDRIYLFAESWRGGVMCAFPVEMRTWRGDDPDTERLERIIAEAVIRFMREPDAEAARAKYDDVIMRAPSLASRLVNAG